MKQSIGMPSDNQTKEQTDLPKWSGDAILPSNVGRLEKSGSPCPLTDDNRRRKAGLDHTTSSAEERRKERKI
jgi:hypothetical protein